MNEKGYRVEQNRTWAFPSCLLSCVLANVWQLYECEYESYKWTMRILDTKNLELLLIIVVVVCTKCGRVFR